MQIRITKGLDIPIAGKPDSIIEAGRPVHSVAVLGDDYVGLKPRMLVQVGDPVSLGQPLFTDKRDPKVLFTSPGSGTVAAINRGARRVLQSVVIELDNSGGDNSGGDNSGDEESRYADLPDFDPATIAPEEIRSALLTSGLWTAFRSRPYNKVPQSDSDPHSIFVTAIDTRPLAANPDIIVAAQREAFLHGLRVIGRLTKGPVFLCTGPEWSGPLGDDEQIRHVEFAGPHPAGLPGTHIHHLDPVGPDQTVWHIGYQDVIAIGRLFSEGRIRVERTLALGGAGFKQPRLTTTRLGANVNELVADGLRFTGAQAKPPRLISGSVLDGRSAAGPEAYLGRYHLQISAIPVDGQRQLFGWLGLFARGYSFAGLFKRRQGHTKSLPFSTARNGRPTAMFPVDTFERIMPLDILPTPLLRALLIKDTDQAQALGCLELDAEDLALCSFVCPGKIDYGAALRINLDQIERDG
jgi:Na+-transporting NADH:ubiquinone oxidoreductase subunit A